MSVTVIYSPTISETPAATINNHQLNYSKIWIQTWFPGHQTWHISVTSIKNFIITVNITLN